MTSDDKLDDVEQVDIEWGFEEVMSGQWGLQGKIEDADAHPTLRDTSGDGLADAEQIEIDWRITWEQDAWAESGAGDVFEAEVTDVDAHPARNTTVDNNFTDAEEFEVGTNPLKWDTAGDGVPDGEDPNPLVHNGWTVYIWAESMLSGKQAGAWEYHARAALEEDLSSQIDLRVEVEDRPDVEAVEMGEYPSSRVDCED